MNDMPQIKLEFPRLGKPMNLRYSFSNGEYRRGWGWNIRDEDSYVLSFEHVIEYVAESEREEFFGALRGFRAKLLLEISNRSHEIIRFAPSSDAPIGFNYAIGIKLASDELAKLAFALGEVEEWLA